MFWKIFLKDILTDHMMHNANWWAFFKSGEEIKIGRLVGIFKQIIPSYPWISLRYIIVLYFDKRNYFCFGEFRGKTVIVWAHLKQITLKNEARTLMDYRRWFFIFHSVILIVQKSFLLSKIFFKGIGTYLQKVHGIYIKITRIIFKND